MNTLISRVATLLMLVSFATLLKAQTYDQDALRYSQIGIQGTARTIGAGGAFGSVGADLGSLSINPAGLGVYRSGELSFSAGGEDIIAHSNYIGEANRSSVFKPTLNNAGIVFTKLFRKSSSSDEIGFHSTSKLVSFSFALGYNRLASYNRNDTYTGTNNNNSLASLYANEINSGDPAQITSEAVQAYQAYLVNFDSTYKYSTPLTNPIRQRINSQSWGKMDEVNISLGGNVSDKYYFGLGIGIPFFDYQNSTDFTESDAGNNPVFSSYTLHRYYQATGYGVNVKVGMLYKPTSWLRLGAAFHSPSFLSINELYSSNIATNFKTSYDSVNQIAYQNVQTPDSVGTYNYKLHTPMKGVFSASFYLNKYGFISVDYELLNYGKMNVLFDGAQPTADTINKTIQGKYTFGHNIRIGAEFALGVLRLRAGYGISLSPFKNGVAVGNYDLMRQNITAGIGYRGKRFFADAAYVFGMTKDYYTAYSTTDGHEPSSGNSINTHAFVITVGVKFGGKR